MIVCLGYLFQGFFEKNLGLVQLEKSESCSLGKDMSFITSFNSFGTHIGMEFSRILLLVIRELRVFLSSSLVRGSMKMFLIGFSPIYVSFQRLISSPSHGFHFRLFFVSQPNFFQYLSKSLF